MAKLGFCTIMTLSTPLTFIMLYTAHHHLDLTGDPNASSIHIHHHLSIPIPLLCLFGTLKHHVSTKSQLAALRSSLFPLRQDGGTCDESVMWLRHSPNTQAPTFSLSFTMPRGRLKDIKNKHNTCHEIKRLEARIAYLKRESARFVPFVYLFFGRDQEARETEISSQVLICH